MRVVVDDVALPDRLVGVEDVADLGDGHADALALGLGEDPLAGHRAGGVTGGVEQDTSWPASCRPRASWSTTSSMPP